MWIYLIVFGISIVLFALSGRIGNKYVKLGVAIIACILPCILAGLRAETIGTDVLVYVKPMAGVAAQSNSFADFLQRGFHSDWRFNYIKHYEIGFTFMVYIVVKVFKSLNWVLFFIQALTIFPIYFGLKHFEKDIPVWQGMTVFFFMNYGTSLNLMRQWIAMAILLYGFKFITENKSIKYLICVAVGVLFHNTALFGIFILLIYKFVKAGKTNLVFSEKLRINKSLRVIEVALLSVLVLLLLNPIINLLNLLGFSRYAIYITGTLELSMNQILIRLPILVLALLSWKSLCQKNEAAQFYLSMILMDLIMSQLASVNMYATRISVYFSEYVLLYMPAIANASNSKKVRIFVKGTLAAYLVAYWYYYYVISGVGETVPYVFA